MTRNTFEIKYVEGENEIKYLFDKTSPDVEFIKYIKSETISAIPRIEIIEEEWRIKSLDKRVKLSRKYTFTNKIGERRNWDSYGSLSTDKPTIGEDVYLEWMPSMLSNPDNLTRVRNLVTEYENVKYNIEKMSRNFDLIFINTNANDRLSKIYKTRYEDLITDVNRISERLLNRNKKLNRNGLTIIDNNNINISNTSSEDNNNENINTMKEIAKTNTSEGLFVPVHLRSAYKNIIKNTKQSNNVETEIDNNDECESNVKLFQVPKTKQKPKKYTFVIKDIPDPNNKTESCIINTLMDYSLTLQDDPSVVSVYILKNRANGRNKNMCLVNFKKEHIKNKVLEECTRCKITMDNSVLIIEDGKKN